MTREAILKRIYPSVVRWNSDWQQMIKDVNKHNLKTISLFLTTSTYEERQEIFKLLQQSCIKKIPHIHIQDDMKEHELDFLVEHFGVKAMTLHYCYMPRFARSKHKGKIFIENNHNADVIRDPKKLAKVGGACIDVSHYHQFGKYEPEINAMSDEIVKKFKVGCNHVSGIDDNDMHVHTVTSVKQLQYLKNIPKKMFSQYICIELNNSISQQLKFREKIADILWKSWNKK